MKKMLLVLLISVVGCASTSANVKQEEFRNLELLQAPQEQYPRTTVLVFNPVVKERKPEALPPPNRFPTKQVRPKKLN